MLIKLIMPPVWWRQSEAATEPVATKIVQVTGQFLQNIFQNRVFLNVLRVSQSHLAGSNGFAKSCEAIVISTIGASMQLMNHSVRSLGPPPQVEL